MRELRLLLALVALAACTRSAAGPVAGELVASWSGSDRGNDRMPAQASLCATDSLVELLAYRDDRAVGLAFHLAGAEPTPAQFAVVNPQLDEIPRPAATGAFRIVPPQGLQGFVSRDGSVDLAEVGPEGLSGRFTLRMVALSGTDTVAMSGTFRGVRLDPAPTPCGRAPRAPVELLPEEMQ